MSLIDYTYFVQNVNIPVSSNTALSAPVTEAIARYEPEILKMLLGYKLYSEMMTAYNASIADPPTALPDIWDDFINGAEFEFELNGNTITEYWIGLKNDSKISLIANYVYFNHRSNTDTKYSGIGEIKSKAENSKVISPRVKMVNALNNMLKMYGETDYYYVPVSNSDYRHFDDSPSAYNFLLANLANYPDWKFKQIESINVWGL